MNLWGSNPSDQCTGNAYYGCQRTGGGGGNILNPIQSARIRSSDSFSFRYGRVEIKAKLPRGDWIWPAIWMLPRYNNYGTWPASGEIDIMESRGNLHYAMQDGGGDGGCNSFGSTLHWGPDYSRNQWQQTHAEYSGDDLSNNFHIYGMKWNSDGIYTYLDDENNRVLDVKFDRSFWEKGGWGNSGLNNPWSSPSNPFAAPFDQKFYLIMNVAVGGTSDYFNDGVGPSNGKPWNNKDPHAVNQFWNAKQQWYNTHKQHTNNEPEETNQ